MSCAPHTLAQLMSAFGAPVFRLPAAEVTHAPFAPLFTPGSLVPVAARSHSEPVGRRLPLARQARSAWNHVRFALGGTPFLLTAYSRLATPVTCPLSGNVPG